LGRIENLSHSNASSNLSNIYFKRFALSLKASSGMGIKKETTRKFLFSAFSRLNHELGRIEGQHQYGLRSDHSTRTALFLIQSKMT